MINSAVGQRFSDRPRNLREMLRRASDRFPNKEALISEGHRVTYQELVLSVNALSWSFQNELNIEKGDRIAILLPNSIEYAISYLGACQVGAISVTLNTRCRSKELEFMINNSRPKMLISTPDMLKRIEPFAQEYFPYGKIILSKEKRNEKIPSLKDLIENGMAKNYDFPEIQEDDLSGLMYTSGTTGKPKGAMISHGNIVANSIALSFVYLCHEDDIDLILAPMFHATGLHGQLMRSVYMGSTCVIAKEFKSEYSLKTIHQERVTVCVAVPTIYWLMMIHPNFNTYDLSSLERIIYGGAPASYHFINMVKEKFPKAKQINAFGLTECTSIATTLPPEEAIRKIDSIGLTAPFTQIKVVDDQNKEVNPNAVGEILIKSPMVCRGYWDNEKATTESFKKGWLRTGDLGKVDEEGFVYLLDRKKDMIIRGGENIYCIEVENVLYSHPNILEAAVVGISDEIFGEQVKACVVLKEGTQVNEEDLKIYCEKYLADYKVPKYIEFLSSLPRNPGGKVIKEELAHKPLSPSKTPDEMKW